MAEGDDAALQRLAFLAEFGKAAVKNDRSADPFGGNLFILGKDTGVADTERDQIDLNGEVVDPGIA